MSADDRSASDKPSLLHVARSYLERGWIPIPLPNGAKAPVMSQWQKFLPTAETLSYHFATETQNIGLLLGEPSHGLVDVDLDAPEAVDAGSVFLPATSRRHGRPGKPDSHWWYVGDPIPATRSWKDPDGTMLCELRSTGAQTLVPPSVHPTRERLTWSKEGEAARLEGPVLERAVALVAACALIARHWPDRGSRHQASLALAGFLLADGLDDATVTTLTTTAARLGGDDEWRQRGRDVIDTAAKVASGEPITGAPTLAAHLRGDGAGVVARLRHWLHLRGLPRATDDDTLPTLSDLGNADRLVAQFSSDLRFVPVWGWMVWDGRRWVRDEGNCRVMAFAVRTVRRMYSEAEQIDKKDQRQSLVSHAKNSEARSRLEAMVKIAEHQVVAAPSEFDRHLWLLNVRNGTIDLRTGTLQPHRHEDLLTKLAPIVYNPEARAPMFEAFLTRITAANHDLIGFLQRSVGYSLTGHTHEQVLFILHGAGSNGKTTFLKIIGEVLGDYAMTTPATTLMVKRDGAIPNDIARLRSARFVTTVETTSGQRLDEAQIKQLTGGDPIAARFLHREFFEYVPECKVYLAVNHKPRIRGTDHAMWRRVRLIPFTVTIPDAEQDPQLAEKLRAELPGILTWAVSGCLDWQAHGLGMHADVRAATEAYRGEEDLIARFLEECCTTEPTATIQSSGLYERYVAWCKQAGEHALTQTMLGRHLAEKGFDSKKKGTKWWIGLGLRDGWDSVDATPGLFPFTHADHENHTNGPNTPNRPPEASASGRNRRCPRCHGPLQAVSDGQGPGRYDCLQCGTRTDYSQTALGFTEERDPRSAGPTSPEAGAAKPEERLE